jgi:DnaJ family protein C protein 13
MGSVEKNRDVVSYYCTKHSWRGKYKRVFTVGTHALSTYNPGSSEQTNIWTYSDVFAILPSPKSNNEFKLMVRKNPGKPQQTDVTFSCEYRLELLTYALKYYPKFSGNQTVEFPRYRCVMIDHTDHRVEVNLILTPCSIEEYTVSGKLLNSYNYKDTQSIARVQDYPGGFVIIYGNIARMVLFGTSQLDELLKNVEREAMKGMGIVINTSKKVISQADFMEGRWGNFSDDQSQTSLTEFNVNLLSTFGESTPRILCLSESCVMERDPNTYNVCTMQPLTDIWALIRHAEDPQMFTIEYNTMSKSTYTCQDRDALLASILDGARGNKNRDICVQAMKTNMGARIGPLYLPVEEVCFHSFEDLNYFLFSAV